MGSRVAMSPAVVSGTVTGRMQVTTGLRMRVIGMQMGAGNGRCEAAMTIAVSTASQAGMQQQGEDHEGLTNAEHCSVLENERHTVIIGRRAVSGQSE